MRCRRAPLIALVFGFSAQAGICPHLNGPRSEFELFAGYSPASPTLIGTEPDRRFVFAGLDYSYLCREWKHVSFSITAGAMPAAIVLQPATVGPVFPPIAAPVAAKLVPPHAVYGFGITPVGATFDFAGRRTLHPFFEFGLGIIASSEPIPENQIDATGLNFLIVVGGGARWKRVSLGYKFVHISNAFTTNFNPGLDNGVIYAGYSLVR
jgi:hypothetical protein